MIEEIKKIIESDSPNTVKQYEIFKEISRNPSAIPNILQFLDIERVENNSLIKDLNLEVSRLDIMCNNPKIVGKTIKEQNEFRRLNIKNLYDKWSHKITHCFKQ